MRPAPMKSNCVPASHTRSSTSATGSLSWRSPRRRNGIASRSSRPMLLLTKVCVCGSVSEELWMMRVPASARARRIAASKRSFSHVLKAQRAECSLHEQSDPTGNITALSVEVSTWSGRKCFGQAALVSLSLTLTLLHKPQTAEYDAKNKYMVTFPYPYMNGRLHLGHTLALFKDMPHTHFSVLSLSLSLSSLVLSHPKVRPN